MIAFCPGVTGGRSTLQSRRAMLGVDKAIGMCIIIIIIKLIISELSVSQLYTTRDRAYNLICLESKNRFQFS